MKRLTKKTVNGFVPTYERETKENYYNLVCKLGELEDIEEELGIDLITLLKASMNGFYTPYISGGINPDKWEPWYFIIDMKDRCFRSLTVIGQLGRTRFYFNEYGKSWIYLDKDLDEEENEY